MSEFNKSGKRKFNSKRNGKANRNNGTSSTKLQDSKTKISQESYNNSDKLVVSPATNDPSWYIDDPNVLKTVASVSFGQRTGSAVDLDNKNIPLSTVMDASDHVPGMCILSTLTGPGIATSSVDPINVAARDIYGYIRTYVTTSQPYDPSDVMMYLLAMDELFMLYYNAKRAYGISSLYNKLNMYAPKMLVESLGWDFDDILKNRAQFISAINMLAIRMSNFVVPANLTLFTRHAWLYSNIFADTNTAKSQLYAFKPVGYRVFDEVTSETGGFLQFKKFDGLLTVDKFIQIVDDITSPLTISSSMMDIEADILKAYPNSELFQMASVPVDYAVMPVYDEMVLAQIENATVFGDPKDMETSCNIIQNPEINESTVLYQPTWDMSTWSAKGISNPILSDRIINAHHDAPSPEWIMEATRLMAIPVVDDDRSEYYCEDAGTEIVLHCEITTMSDDFEAVTIKVDYNDPFIFDNSTTVASVHNDLNAIIAKFSLLSMFRYHPFYSFYSANSASTTLNRFYFFMDIDNYAVLSGKILKDIHNYALLNLFDIGKKYNR